METLTKENYYDFAKDYQSLDEIVVSNSSLSYVNPNEGGSWKRFENFLRGEGEKKESRSLEKGKIIHTYFENPNDFATESENLPSEKVIPIIKATLSHIRETGIEPTEGLDQYQEVLLLKAREIGFGAANWTSATILAKLLEAGASYFDHLIRSDGKIMTDKKTKEALEGIKSSISLNEQVKNEFIEGNELVVKEWPILFEFEGIMCKALLDNTVVNISEKLVHIRDIKTTSIPVSKYMAYSVFDPFTNNFKLVGGSFFHYRTYRQLAFYEMAVRYWLIENGYDPKEFTFNHSVLACETIDPYEIQVYDIKRDYILAGVAEIQDCMNLVKMYISSQTQSM